MGVLPHPLEDAPTIIIHTTTGSHDVGEPHVTIGSGFNRILCHDGEWLEIFPVELPRISDHADLADTTVGIDDGHSCAHKAVNDYGYVNHYT